MKDTPHPMFMVITIVVGILLLCYVLIQIYKDDD